MPNVPLRETSARVNPAPEALWPLISGALTTQLLYVAVKLGLPEAIDETPRSVAEIRGRLALRVAFLERLLHALASIGLVNFADGGTAFVAGRLLPHLRAGSKGAMRDWAIIAGELHYPCLQELLPAITTGSGSSATDFWTLLDRRPETRESFYRAMDDQSRWLGEQVTRVFDFPEAVHLVDVGGGSGGLLVELLSRLPGATGVLCDRAEAGESFAATTHASRVAHRCRFEAGNFLECVPSGGDVYLLKNVLHDWDDMWAVQILCACREASQDHGTLLIVESFLPERPSCRPDLTSQDLQLLVAFGGRKRRVSEIRRLASKAGLEIVEVAELARAWGLLVARRVGIHAPCASASVSA